MERGKRGWKETAGGRHRHEQQAQDEEEKKYAERTCSPSGRRSSGESGDDDRDPDPPAPPCNLTTCPSPAPSPSQAREPVLQTLRSCAAAAAPRTRVQEREEKKITGGMHSRRAASLLSLSSWSGAASRSPHRPALFTSCGTSFDIFLMRFGGRFGTGLCTYVCVSRRAGGGERREEKEKSGTHRLAGRCLQRCFRRDELPGKRATSGYPDHSRNTGLRRGMSTCRCHSHSEERTSK